MLKLIVKFEALPKSICGYFLVSSLASLVVFLSFTTAVVFSSFSSTKVSSVFFTSAMVESPFVFLGIIPFKIADENSCNTVAVRLYALTPSTGRVLSCS